MLKGGPHTSVQDHKKQQQLQQQQLQEQQQKQKKRLSFRDPEVEGPQKNSFFGGVRSKTLARPTSSRPKVPIPKKLSSSVEDLTLEDHALQRDRYERETFSSLSPPDNGQADYFEAFPSDIDRETEIIDNSPPDVPPRKGFQISDEDDEFLEDLVAPQFDFTTMRGPAIENEDDNSRETCIPIQSPFRERSSSTSSTQHQLQMLRYQLEQQNQQTQLTMHQVQLLQDQVDAENAARRKAQEQNNILMQQNQELLNHIEKLFLQIEELEKQVQVLEQEKINKRTTLNQKPQVSTVKQPASYTTNRRPSIEPEKLTVPRSSYTAARKNSLTLTKPFAITAKSPATQSVANTVTATVAAATRKNPVPSPKSYVIQNKNLDSATKAKDSLRIGDGSPTVQSNISPFTSIWKTKSGIETTKDKIPERNRAGSFSSFTKKPQETSSTAKSTLFSSGGSLSTTATTTNKKYSSSTSDLYSSPTSSLQAKSSLMIEDPSTSGVRSAVSNLSISSTSKLPRYQPYTGWQRRTSLTNDAEPISGLSKDLYKNTSLFNR